MSEISLDTGTLNQTRAGRELINIVSDAGKYLFGFSTEKEVKQLKEKIGVLAAQSGNFCHMGDQQFSYIKDVAAQVLESGNHPYFSGN